MKRESDAALSLTESGAGHESRTRDLNLGKVALYQLSYSRGEALNYNVNRSPVKVGAACGVHCARRVARRPTVERVARISREGPTLAKLVR